VEFELTEDQATIRTAVAELAGRFDDRYWMEHDRDKLFPEEFYDAVKTQKDLPPVYHFPEPAARVIGYITFKNET